MIQNCTDIAAASVQWPSGSLDPTPAGNLHACFFRPYDLRKFSPNLWVNNPQDCWELTTVISNIKHYEIIDKRMAKNLRPRDAVEIKTDKINVFPIPKWKKQRL